MNYKAPKNLLSTKNSKTIKGEKLGYTTYIMYLAPHKQNSKGVNLCSHASVGCAKACLFNSGAARFNRVQVGKINKTEYFLADKKGFMAQLVNELTKIEKLHKAVVGDEQTGRTGKVVRYKKFAVRLNGTSDIPFENIKVNGKNVFELFPNVQFYDYTKNHKRFENKIIAPNYHLTFSRSETNDKISLDILNRGYNVAYVFGVKKEQDLPSEYNGFKVVNGDESDLRFLDDKNVVVGLKYKNVTGEGGKVSNDNSKESGFVIDTETL
jgi:hypothetical protein